VKHEVPDHDLLVGGFPCQDYSVAATNARGIEGKNGNLWWHINDILKAKRPPFVLLENVDRLLKSPVKQRGRDFGIMLRCLHDLGYDVEWRVINAADYGYPQRRRRVFIFAFHSTTGFYKLLENKTDSIKSYYEWLARDSFFAKPFPVQDFSDIQEDTYISLREEVFRDLETVGRNFYADFHNTGLMHKGNIYTRQVISMPQKPGYLGDVLLRSDVDKRYFINEEQLERWNYLKGAKKIPRAKPDGQLYYYSEGAVPFPDKLDTPSRTILTSEGSLNRSTHVVQDLKTSKFRLLTPVECERLQGFPDDWTNTGMPDRMRYFVMGNALVVPLVTRMGERLLEIAD